MAGDDELTTTDDVAGDLEVGAEDGRRNVATAELAATGVLDIMSSDYVPSSLLLASLRLPEAVPQFDLPAAIRTVSRTPAHAVGLTDRGEIAVGKRADLVRVFSRAGASTARMVWREGRRVA